MNQIPRDDFVKNLVRLLLKSEMEEGNNHMIQIDRKTFSQLLLYILMEEVLGAEKEIIDAQLLKQLDEMMLDIQKEVEEILTMLKTKG